MISRQRPNGIPVDIKALSFSAQWQEPSFYWGLFGPSLHLALQGGIAYRWGLWTYDPGPEIRWILSPVTISSPGTAPLEADSFTCTTSNSKIRYVVWLSFFGSYTSSDLHIDSTIEAICRAMVSLARLGFVPPSSSIW